MSAHAIASLLDLPDPAFQRAWGDLSIEERSALPEEVRTQGFARIRKLTKHIDRSIERMSRGQEHLDARISVLTWPPALDLEALAEHEPLAPKFIIPGWLPVGYAAGIFGHGGIGKSHAVALTLAVCVAAGVPFYGLAVTRCRVTLLSCEDRENVLHWRLARTCAALGVDLASLRGWLEIIDLVGQESVLWAADPREGKVLTAAYGVLMQRMAAQPTELLIVDGIADTFGGNENARGDVKRFVNALLALIPADRGAVFLVGHVDKATARNGSTSEGYSGSTGWNNSMRARWYLRPETQSSEEGDRPERTGELVLELQKSNLARADQSIRLRWDDEAHVFTGAAEGTGFANLDRVTQQRDEEAAILAALRACSERGYVPAATSGRRTAYHVLMAAREFPDSLRTGKPAVRRFWKLIEALRHRGDIIDDVERGPDRHRVAVLCPAGNAGNTK